MTMQTDRSRIGGQINKLDSETLRTAVIRITFAMRSNFQDPASQAEEVIDILADYGVMAVEDLEANAFEDE